MSFLWIYSFLDFSYGLQHPPFIRENSPRNLKMPKVQFLAYISIYFLSPDFIRFKFLPWWNDTLSTVVDHCFVKSVQKNNNNLKSMMGEILLGSLFRGLWKNITAKTSVLHCFISCWSSLPEEILKCVYFNSSLHKISSTASCSSFDMF